MGRDIRFLHPDLQVKAEELIEECKAKGIFIIVTQALRTKEEQDGLYAQGRTKPGKIVTKVKYPHSMHCWGLAFDIAVIRGGQAVWDTAAYATPGQIGESIGLEWGGRWKEFPDAPHFQMPGANVNQLTKTYGTPEAFLKTWRKEAENVPGFEKNTKVKLFTGKTLEGGILEGKTYVELRALAEELDLVVKFDAKSKQIEVEKGA